LERPFYLFLKVLAWFRGALNAKDQGLKSKDQELKSKDQELRSKDKELKSKDQEIGTLRGIVAHEMQQAKDAMQQAKERGDQVSTLIDALVDASQRNVPKPKWGELHSPWLLSFSLPYAHPL